MKQGIPELENRICELVHQFYAFYVSAYEFVPIGDSAYSYMVENAKHERRYLKVFDTTTQKGSLGAKKLKQYVPLMLELSESNLFRDLPKPYYTISGDLQCSFERFTCVLFDYIDGETLADSYPFSDDVQTRLGEQLAKLHAVPLTHLCSQIVKESYRVDFGDGLHKNLKSLQFYKGDDRFILRLQSIVLPKTELINRFWNKFCEQQSIALQSTHAVVLCHGDLWGGNIMKRVNLKLVFLDWEGAVVAPIERDLFSYVDSEYTTLRLAYAEARQMNLSLNPDLVAFYAYRHQLRNLNQWLHNLLNENFDDDQKENDLEMIGFHCLDRWTSIETTVSQLYEG